jgi:predicted permease
MQRSATRSPIRSLWPIARLRRGVTLQAAQADLASISKQLARDFPGTNAGWTARVVPLSDAVLGQVRPPIVALSIVAALLMLIAGVNLVSLLLSRALERRREIGIRLALGARSAHLFGILLGESLAVAAVAGVIGGGAAWGAVRVALVVAPALIPRADEISVDPVVLAFAILLPVVVALVAAVAGGLPVLRRAPEEVLRPSAPTRGVGRSRLGIIVAGEVALATVLVTAAALGVSSYSRLLATPLGFDRTHVSITRFLPLPTSLRAAVRRLFPGQPRPDDRELFRVWIDEVLDSVTALPGVSGAAVAEYTPFDTREVREQPIRIPGRENPGAGIAAPSAVVTPVSPDYFAVLRVALVRGRLFSRDDRASTTPVAIVSLAAARRYWGQGEVVGQKVAIAGEKIPRTIVGVANDIILGTPASAARPFVYLPFAQYPRPWLGLVVRAASPAEQLAPAIRRSLEAARFRPFETTPLDNLFERTVAKPRLVAWTVAACAAIALVVGASGVFAVLAFSVRQRRREIAVRLAIGASPGRIVGQTLRESATWVLVGFGVGLPAAAALSMAATTTLFDVSPLAPQVWLSVIGVLVLAGLAGALVPTLRASRVDAMEALRTE